MGELKVLWTHNFNPAQSNSQVYMKIAAEAVRRQGADLELQYLGNLRSPVNLLRARASIRQAARGFDIVHAQYGSACGLATAGVDGVPKVLSIRGNDWAVHNGASGFLYIHTRIARAMTMSSLSRYDCLLSVSNRLAAELRPHSPGAYVETLPSPIDLERFVPRDRAEARACLGYPASEEKWVLFNALNLDDAVKRYDLARAAFDLASRRLGNIRFRVATGLGHEEIALFVAACDLILCTSETEGWPNSVKEALACNVPFVSTDVSDLREIAALEPSCRICPPDPQALASAICEVLSGPAPRDLRQHVLNMGLDASGRRLVGLYGLLVSTFRGAR